MNVSKKHFCLVDSLRNFLKTFGQASKFRFPYRSPKLRLDLRSQKIIFVLITITISLNIQIDKFFYHSVLDTTILAYFSPKSLNYTAINLFLQKLSTLAMVKFTISTRTDITLQTSVKHLRAILMCSAFTADCGIDNITIILIGDVYCPHTKCLGKLCLHKKTFQSLGRSSYQCSQCGSVCQLCNLPFENQTNSFLMSLGQGVYIFEESPKPVEDVIGDVYCPGKCCSNREKCESLGGYVQTPRSIYAFGKCGAWLFVHKVLFMLQEQVKTTKTDRTRLFLCYKKINLVPNKQLVFNVPFQSIKNRKKELSMGDKVRETFGDVYCPTCRNEKCVYISTNKTTNFYDCKKCKACCNVLNTPLKDQKPTLMLYGDDGTHCFTRKTSRD